MATITQTNEWFRICNKDPQIQRASQGPQLIMDSLMDAIECNDVWNQIQQTDSMIQQAEQVCYEAEKGAAAILPRDVFNRLSEATTSVESARITAAILYGMRVSKAISTATANQVDFSRYVLDRTKGGTVHG